MDKELTVPKWALTNCLKIPQMPQNVSAQNVSVQNASAQIVSSSPNFRISMKKSSVFLVHLMFFSSIWSSQRTDFQVLFDMC